MTPSLLRRLDRSARGAIPLVVTLLLVLLAALPIPLPAFAPVTPALTVICVYYWSIHRPDLLPLVATFLVGLVQDALQGTPLGMSSVVLLGVQGVVVSQRRFFLGKTFLVEWWTFMLVAPGAAILTWVLASLYFTTPLSPRPLGVQLLLTIALYPIANWAFARLRQSLLHGA